MDRSTAQLPLQQISHPKRLCKPGSTSALTIGSHSVGEFVVHCTSQVMSSRQAAKAMYCSTLVVMGDTDRSDPDHSLTTTKVKLAFQSHCMLLVT